MPRKESKFLKILLVIEDLLILFDDYVDKHDPGPFPEDFMTLGMRRNQYHFIKKDILDKNLNFKQRPQTLLKSIKKPWDENWSFILFDIPEKHSSTRNTLRRNIYKFGFRKLQRSVWFSPLPLETWTQKLDEEFNGLDYFTLVSGKIHQCNPQKIIKEKWQIKNWANRANDWIKKNKKLTKKNQKAFWELMLDHPKVPLDLLPRTWPLKKLFLQFWNKKLKN